MPPYRSPALPPRPTRPSRDFLRRRHAFARRVLVALALATAPVPGVTPVHAETPSVRDTAVDEAPAGTAGDAALELEPIVVDADVQEEERALVERSFETPEDVSGFGEVIHAEPTWRSFESTAELLGESVGAQLNRRGGRDDFATLTIRGAPAAQVRVLLDGISLGRASDSVVNLADLPLDIVDRIEVYRGFAPVGLSPASAAGVVNVVTRDPGKPTVTAAAGGGSFGGAKVHVGGAGPVAGGSAAAFASWRHSDGHYRYLDDNGSVTKPDDDRVLRLKNNDSDAVESLVRWRRDVTDSARVQLRNHTFSKDEGIPGLGRFRAPAARLETFRDVAALSVGGTESAWSAEQAVTSETKKLRDAGSFEAINNDDETIASTTIARWGAPLGDSHWVSASGDFTWESFEQTVHSGSTPGQEADRSVLAVAAGDDWSVEAIDLTLIFQLRHQQLWSDSNGARSSTDGSTDPRFGLRWEPVGGLAFKANVSTYFRPPSFDELYGADGFTVGNPALRPEEGTAWDAGLEWSGEFARVGRLSVSYSWFGSNIEDVILVSLDFDRQARATNEDKARIRGHEARVEWSGPAGFALSANYTYQDTENRSDKPGLRGLELEGLAAHEGWARLSWARGPVTIAYDADVTGEHFTDQFNIEKLPTRTIHSLTMVLGPFLDGWRLTLQADNLGDSLVPDQVGFPLPGRSFFATISWSGAGDTEDAG